MKNWKLLGLWSIFSFCKRKGIIIYSYVCLSSKGGIIATLEEKISVSCKYLLWFCSHVLHSLSIVSLCKSWFHYVRLNPAIGSEGAFVLSMKSLLRSKIFCESQGMVIQRRFLCTVPLHALITCCHKTSKESKILFMKFNCIWPIYCPSSPEEFFSLFF